MHATSTGHVSATSRAIFRGWNSSPMVSSRSNSATYSMMSGAAMTPCSLAHTARAAGIAYKPHRRATPLLVNMSSETTTPSVERISDRAMM
ncbi:MAG: hypothetical protein DMF99_02750 [Acidobacteria bacterium]|nr:MAG: hypothetical protein DMF99_02750 [Acidobacteriota bacterium]